MTRAGTPSPTAKSFSFTRLLPLLALVAGLVAFFALGLHHYVSFEVLGDNREVLLTWVHQHRVLAVVLYMAVYVVSVAFSLLSCFSRNCRKSGMYSSWRFDQTRCARRVYPKCRTSGWVSAMSRSQRRMPF